MLYKIWSLYLCFITILYLFACQKELSYRTFSKSIHFIQPQAIHQSLFQRSAYKKPLNGVSQCAKLMDNEIIECIFKYLMKKTSTPFWFRSLFCFIAKISQTSTSRKLHERYPKQRKQEMQFLEKPSTSLRSLRTRNYQNL